MKIVAIIGSTRKYSSNHSLVKAIAQLYAGKIELTIFESIAELPHFNPDLEGEHTPPAVIHFRERIRNADGVLICTPEYAHGVPGSLKNAIDWTVTTGDFSHKPTALITASTDGRSGHAALLETLRVIEAENIDQLQLLLPFIRTKLNEDGTIKDEATMIAVRQLTERFFATIRAQENIGK